MSRTLGELTAVDLGNRVAYVDKSNVLRDGDLAKVDHSMGFDGKTKHTSVVIKRDGWSYYGYESSDIELVDQIIVEPQESA